MIHNVIDLTHGQAIRRLKDGPDPNFSVRRNTAWRGGVIVLRCCPFDVNGAAVSQFFQNMPRLFLLLSLLLLFFLVS
jgi:hypothetical protein